MSQSSESLSTPVIAGIDIGGTKISALLVAGDGTVLTRGVVPAPARDGGAAMADAAAGLVERLLVTTGARLAAAGVGAAGVVDQSTGVIRAASAMFVDWVGFPLGDTLTGRLGVPVVVENDVNAFLLGEVAFGAASGADVLGVMLGTGVGGALVIDGRLHHGPHGAAGEIGHTPGYSDLMCTCGQVGHLETLASGTSLGLRYGERTGHTGLEARAVADRARAGDADARAVFRAAGRAVALACASAATLIDLPIAVIGGRGRLGVGSPRRRDHRDPGDGRPRVGSAVAHHPRRARSRCRGARGRRRARRRARRRLKSSTPESPPEPTTRRTP